MSDDEGLSAAERALLHRVVAGRLRHAAEFALAHLISASGGSHHLTPVQFSLYREAVLALEALKAATSVERPLR